MIKNWWTFSEWITVNWGCYLITFVLFISVERMKSLMVVSVTSMTSMTVSVTSMAMMAASVMMATAACYNKESRKVVNFQMEHSPTKCSLADLMILPWCPLCEWCPCPPCPLPTCAVVSRSWPAINTNKIYKKKSFFPNLKRVQHFWKYSLFLFENFEKIILAIAYHEWFE